MKKKYQNTKGFRFRDLQNKPLLLCIASEMFPTTAHSADLLMLSNVEELPLDQDEKRVCSINTMINYYNLLLNY